MSTLAIASYGIALRLGDGTPLTTLTVTGATNATPIVVTTSTNHNIADVGVASISGVTGTTAANNTVGNPVWIVKRVSATQLTLRGSVGNGAYVSGGSLIRTETFATIAEPTSLQDAGVQTTLVDVSAHDGNGFMSQIPVLVAVNAIRLSLNLVAADPSHDESTGLLSLAISKAKRNFLLVLPDTATTAWLFHGYVVQHKTNPATPTSAFTAETIIAMVDAPLLSAA